MKKLILFTALLIMSFVQAQNSSSTQAIIDRVKQSDERKLAEKKAQDAKDAIFNHPNADYIKSLGSLNEETARKFADEIALGGKTQWEFLKISEDIEHRVYAIVYLDISLPNETITGLKKGTITDCSNCLKIRFNTYYQGENKALEIKGVKAFKFDKVYGRYLDLFPIWKKVFRPDVELEATVSAYENRELRHRSSGIIFKLQDETDYWQLSNWSN